MRVDLIVGRDALSEGPTTPSSGFQLRSGGLKGLFAGCKLVACWGRPLNMSLSSPSISASLVLCFLLMTTGREGLCLLRRFVRKNAKAARRATTASAPITIPAMAPPEIPECPDDDLPAASTGDMLRLRAQSGSSGIPCLQKQHLTHILLAFHAYFLHLCMQKYSCVPQKQHYYRCSHS